MGQLIPIYLISNYLLYRQLPIAKNVLLRSLFISCLYIHSYLRLKMSFKCPNCHPSQSIHQSTLHSLLNILFNINNSTSLRFQCRSIFSNLLPFQIFIQISVFVFFHLPCFSPHSTFFFYFLHYVYK